MPILTNEKHENFCRYVVLEGMSARQAAMKAGFDEKTSYALSQRPDLIARMTELREDREEQKERRMLMEAQQRMVTQGITDPRLLTETVVKLEDITVEFLINQLLDVALEAKKAKQFASANKSFQLIAEAMGLFDMHKKEEEERKKELEKRKENAGEVTLEKLAELLDRPSFKGLLETTKEKK